MVLTIHRYFRIYRRFELDIWGLSFSNMNLLYKATSFFFKIHLINRARKASRSKRYVYRVDLINPGKRHKRLKSTFASLRLLKLFYLTLSYKRFSFIASLASRMDGYFQSIFCRLLEGRLVPFFYRTNFLYNMFEIIELVKNKIMYVNGRMKSYVNSSVFIGDFVTFQTYLWPVFRRSLVKRSMNKTFVFNTPRFLYVNYKLFFSVFVTNVYNRDLAFPINLDLYRLTSFK